MKKPRKPKPYPAQAPVKAPVPVIQNPVIENLLEIDALMNDVGVFCIVKFKLDALYEKVKAGKGTSSDLQLVSLLEDCTRKTVRMMNVLKSPQPLIVEE
jgi:hypothetical protein